MKYFMEMIQHKHVLNQEERNDISLSMAQANTDIKTLKDEAKSAASAYKAKIDKKSADVDLYALQIRDGFKFIDIYAAKRKNFETGHWEWFNEESGEVYKKEPFSSKMDYQMSVEDQDEWDEAHKQQEPSIEDQEATEVTEDDEDPDFKASFLMLGTGEDDPNKTDDDNDESDDSDDDEPEEPKKGRGRPRKDK